MEGSHHARLVKVKNVSADVSERQALSNLIRCSRSRDPIMKYDSLSTLMSRVDVGDASLAGWHCRDVPLFPIMSGWERSGNRFKRLLSCVGISKLSEWFLLFFRTMWPPVTQKTVASLRMAERCVYKYYTPSRVALFLARLVLAAAFSRAASRRIFGCHLRATATDTSPLMRQPPAFRKSCSESQTARI